MIRVGLSGHEIQWRAIFTVVRNSKSSTCCHPFWRYLSRTGRLCSHEDCAPNDKAPFCFWTDTRHIKSTGSESHVLEYTAEKFQNSVELTLQHQFPNSCFLRVWIFFKGCKTWFVMQECVIYAKITSNFYIYLISSITGPNTHKKIKQFLYGCKLYFFIVYSFKYT